MRPLLLFALAVVLLAAGWFIFRYGAAVAWLWAAAWLIRTTNPRKGAS